MENVRIGNDACISVIRLGCFGAHNFPFLRISNVSIPRIRQDEIIDFGRRYIILGDLLIFYFVVPIKVTKGEHEVYSRCL